MNQSNIKKYDIQDKDKVSSDDINSLKNKGYVPVEIDIENKSYNNIFYYLEKIVKEGFIETLNNKAKTDNNPVQEVLITENGAIEFKINGEFHIQNHLPSFSKMHINYFLGAFCNLHANGEDSELRYLGTTAKELSNRFEEVHKRFSRPFFIFDNMLADNLLNNEKKSYDFTADIDEYRLRGKICYIFSGENNKPLLFITLKLQPKEIPRLEDLNLPKRVYEIVDLESGIILIGGHANSGKSTTMNSIILEKDLESSKRKFITILQESVEFMFPENKCKIVQRVIGEDTPSYSTASDDALRQGQDIVVFGELLRHEEIYNALRLAESGKLVIATVHTSSVAGTFDRLTSEFPLDQQENIKGRLVEQTSAILHQELIAHDKLQLPKVTGVVFSKQQVDSTYSEEREEFRSQANPSKIAKLIRPQDNPQDWIINPYHSFNAVVDKEITFPSKGKVSSEDLVLQSKYGVKAYIDEKQ